MTTRIIHHGDESHVVYIARVSSNQEITAFVRQLGNKGQQT